MLTQHPDACKILVSGLFIIGGEVMDRYDENYEAFIQCVDYVEEVFVDLRKGVAQTRYIGMVDESAEYLDDKGNTIPVPQEIVGYWMLEYPSDLHYTSFSEALRSEVWVKCVRKEIVSYEYEGLPYV